MKNRMKEYRARLGLTQEKLAEIVGVRRETIIYLEKGNDLPPEKESSFMLDWGLRKGASNGQKILHSRADYQ